MMRELIAKVLMRSMKDGSSKIIKSIVVLYDVRKRARC